MKKSHILGAGVVSALAVTLTGCSVLQPEETGLGDNITVSSSEEAPYEAKDTDDKEVTSNLAEPVKDKGLGVSWELQGVYSCLLYTSPSPRDVEESRMPSSA